MQYLLDELHSYKEDFSDALAPRSQEASTSFAGEAALVHPASTEALHMTHASLTANMTTLHTAVVNLSAMQDALAKDMRQNFNDMTNLIRTNFAGSLGTLASPQDTNGE